MGRFSQRVLLNHIRCPECGVPMVERAGKKGTFYGCSRFPLCIGSRPQGGDGVDSYSALLHKSYVRATRFLSSPKFMGYADTPRWLLEQSLGRPPTEAELEGFDIADIANEHLERGIDAACAWASERADETVDFLINAHEERYASLRMKLKYVTTAEQIQRMPKPEIIRRYDASNLSQFEADIAGNWKEDGIYCPRCGSWSEGKDDSVNTIVFDGKTLTDADLVLTDEEMESLFDDDKPTTIVLWWECGRCGLFSRTTKSKGRAIESEEIEFANDAKDPTFIKGVTFKPSAVKGRGK